MKRRAFVLLLVLLPIAASSAAPQARGRSDGRPRETASDSGVNHTVQRGETLFSIAEKYYGDGYSWVRIKEYNPWVDQDHLNIGEIIHIPDPRYIPAGAVASSDSGGGGGSKTSFNLPSARSLFAWVPNLSAVSIFGRNLNQIILILLVWFFIHFAVQGVFVWFAAHLAFVKDVSIKKAMRATLQSESLALFCIIVASLVGLMLLYIGTTSPGKPVSAEILSTAEDYLGSPMGMALSGMLIVGLYAFLGIRFIPPAFGIQAGRGIAVVMISILIPHLIGMYLLGHRMGIIN